MMYNMISHALSKQPSWCLFTITIRITTTLVVVVNRAFGQEVARWQDPTSFKRGRESKLIQNNHTS